MKATLEFDLGEDGEDLSFQQAIKAHDMSCVISDLWNHIRSVIKHEETSEETNSAYERVRSELRELLVEYGVQDVIW